MRRYYPHTVWDYVKDFNDTPMDIIEGTLIDTYIIYHSENLIEVFEETYETSQSSVYVRHIYRKGLPKRFTKALEEQEEYYNSL